MTTVVVLADPPAVDPLSRLQGTLGPRTQSLYEAMLTDVCVAVQEGDGDLLVNHPPAERVPDGIDPEAAISGLLEPELPRPDDARFEVQVGETYAGRVGNAVTHLFDAEGEQSVAVLEPTAPLFRRDHLGSAAMKLRTSEVVLGPSPGGSLTFAGFSEPLDFQDVCDPPALESLTGRARETGLGVDFLPMLPLVEDDRGLGTLVSLVRARQQAGRIIPERTASCIEEWELSVDSDGTVSAVSDSS